MTQAPVTAARPPARTLSIGGTAYPLYLPSLRDPRLHVAAVIITIHVLGQVGLHFRVSVPQILAAILTTAFIEVALTFRSSKAFVWPASAMLTGSGVALILRVVGTPPDDPWNTYAWWVFAGVAAFALLTKYVIKYRGTHVFNPSNIGLVIAFIVLGSTRIEPLDFWWAPLTNPAMLTAYVVIIGGGLLITRRLHLLALAATFWVSLAVGVGLLAASGHSMIANWSFAPVSGFDFWRVIVTSPEVMIFLFFMITDPKTVPAGRVGRVIFGFLVAAMSVLLMAPQTDEFGTKVGLLAGLVVVCAVRPILDRLLPEPRSTSDEIGGFARRMALGNAGMVRAFAGVGLTLGLVLVLGVGIVAAGTPARGVAAPNVAEVARPRAAPGGPVHASRRSPSARTCPTGTTRSRGRARRRSCRRWPRTSRSRTRRCYAATRRSCRPSTTATGWTRCRRASPRRPRRARPPSTATGSTRSRCG